MILKFQLTPVPVTTINSTNKNKCCKDVEEKEHFYTVGENVN
jgi:hypothetical protein